MLALPLVFYRCCRALKSRSISASLRSGLHLDVLSLLWASRTGVAQHRCCQLIERMLQLTRWFVLITGRGNVFPYLTDLLTNLYGRLYPPERRPSDLGSTNTMHGFTYVQVRREVMQCGATTGINTVDLVELERRTSVILAFWMFAGGGSQWLFFFFSVVSSSDQLHQSLIHLSTYGLVLKSVRWFLT
jgi:hypothetical protein